MIIKGVLPMLAPGAHITIQRDGEGRAGRLYEGEAGRCRAYIDAVMPDGLLEVVRLEPYIKDPFSLVDNHPAMRIVVA